MHSDSSALPVREHAATADALSRCAELLEAVVADRGLLAQLPAEERRRLLRAAGRISRPGRDEARCLRRTFKKLHKHSERSADRGSKDATGIRAARAAPVFVAPAQLPLPAG